MSGDLESLLRSEMAEMADAAPRFDDPGLADLAIAGAGRIRRRRRVGAAASGASLLVLGAAAFVWQPWTGSDPDGGVTAADTSTTEVQLELDMEFVVRSETGLYEVLNNAGESVVIGQEEPASGVYRLAEAYMSETGTAVGLTSFDGTVGTEYDKPSMDTYTRVNSGGTQFAMISPNDDYTQEENHLVVVDAALAAPAAEERTFTTSFSVSLTDWSTTTAVFSADLKSVSGGDTGLHYFDDQYDLGLASVGEAGFESVALTDYDDPNYVCVADLEAGAGLARDGEQCGPLDSEAVQEELIAAASDADAPALVRRAVDQIEVTNRYPLVEDFDLGEYEDRYHSGGMMWTDPLGRWQLVGDSTDDTWLLLDDSGDEPVLAELTPPDGAIMPVLRYD